ncbi:MAG: SUMF1/EgtB/PvdO family nonheme iron enzyme [Anaerolineaceae bacterium]|nr:SUMF1/EgtB/PvdO family nonheme iron enzyme [Anaerolineaceae bacterium]
MTRQNYGSLRGGGSSRRGGAWQWTVIGFVFGFGCAAIVGLVLIITGGADALSGVFSAGRATPTAVVMVITSTPLPATPTPEPTVGIVPSATSAEAQIAAPVASATTNIQVQVQPSATTPPTTAPTTPVPQVAQIPSDLIAKRSPLIQVPGGSFEMGTKAQEAAIAAEECTSLWNSKCDPNDASDSFPPHQVTVSPFYIEEKEVTYDQYLAFLNAESIGMGARNAKHKNGCEGQLCIETRTENQNSNIISDSQNYRVNAAISNFPVAGVTWYGAQAYCAAIGRRLPTEAEWEHAARGASNTIYPWGNEFSVNNARTSRPQETDAALVGPKPVGSYLPFNGLYDMAGNIAEWVSDWYDPLYYTTLVNSGTTIVDPKGPVAGTQKVLRGGSWDALPFFARSVHRQSLPPLGPTLWAGFRCANNTSDTGTTPDAAGNIGTTGNTGGAAPVATVASGTGGSEENAQPLVPPPLTDVPQPTANTTPLATLNSGAGG